MKCFLTCSEKPAEIPEDNLFSRHLPAKLYLFLNGHDLLDEQKHSYSFLSETGSEASATIIVEADAKARANYPAFVSIRVEKHQDGRYFHDLFVFKNRVWFMSMDDDVINGVRGNSKSSSMISDPLTDKQCVKKTPKEVDFIINRLGKMIAPQPAPVNRCVLC